MLQSDGGCGRWWAAWRQELILSRLRAPVTTNEIIHFEKCMEKCISQAALCDGLEFPFPGAGGAGDGSGVSKQAGRV